MKSEWWHVPNSFLFAALISVLFIPVMWLTLNCLAATKNSNSVNASEELARKSMRVREVESGTVGIRCFVLFNSNGTMVQAFSCAPQLPPPWQ